MKFKSYISGKIKRNMTLFILIILGLITTLLGLYYNTIRESKTLYHYATRDSKDKTQSLFFQRNTDLNEDKKVVKEIFIYKKGSIVNFSSNESFYILDDSNIDQVVKYDFNTDKSEIIYTNPGKDKILDIFLDKNGIFILAINKIIKLDFQNQALKEYNIGSNEKFNEFFDVDNKNILLKSNNCKYIKEKCNINQSKILLSYNLESGESKNSNLDSEKNLSFFGTNKIYKLNKLNKYETDKGVVNYNFRIFTQF